MEPGSPTGTFGLYQAENQFRHLDEVLLPQYARQSLVTNPAGTAGLLHYCLLPAGNQASLLPGAVHRVRLPGPFGLAFGPGASGAAWRTYGGLSSSLRLKDSRACVTLFGWSLCLKSTNGLHSASSGY